MKPCPFCGETPIVHTRKNGIVSVECSTRHGCVLSSGWSTPTQWNKRPIEDQLRAENERLREALGLIQNWTKAYPLEMFPIPDFKLARKLLEDGGVSYDGLNVYSMRHVINGVSKIVNDALEVTK
ncbi:hypothetical protein IH575_04805 [Candidatus Dojkabacteria bacterium]|nr:hypothetical protein [Candidatus Dojkabacteria bacterium]